MNEFVIKGKAAAWDTVWEELLKGNPEFVVKKGSGQSCALEEIRRLQRLEKDAERYRKLRATQGPKLDEAVDKLLDTPK
jgi:hypothetical protein